jgi:hypothetical protein
VAGQHGWSLAAKALPQIQTQAQKQAQIVSTSTFIPRHEGMEEDEEEEEEEADEELRAAVRQSLVEEKAAQQREEDDLAEALQQSLHHPPQSLLHHHAAARGGQRGEGGGDSGHHCRVAASSLGDMEESWRCHVCTLDNDSGTVLLRSCLFISQIHSI